MQCNSQNISQINVTDIFFEAVKRSKARSDWKTPLFGKVSRKSVKKLDLDLDSKSRWLREAPLKKVQPLP